MKVAIREGYEKFEEMVGTINYNENVIEGMFDHLSENGKRDMKMDKEYVECCFTKTDLATYLEEEVFLCLDTDEQEDEIVELAKSTCSLNEFIQHLDEYTEDRNDPFSKLIVWGNSFGANTRMNEIKVEDIEIAIIG